MGLCFISLVSCAVKPEPELTWKPDFVQVSAYSELSTVTLVAELSSPGGVSECGFMWGRSKEKMNVVYSTLKHNAFTAVLTNLEYGTEYIYKAFVANGHNTICSELSSVITQDEPFLRISVTEVVLESSADKIEVSVEANVGYEVHIPQNTGEWLSYDSAAGLYTFYAAENISSESRNCVVLFKSLVNNLVCVLTITQKAHNYTLSLPFLEMNLCSEASNFKVDVSGDADFSVHIPRANDWLQCTRVDRTCVFAVAENLYADSRSCEVVFKSLSHDCELIMTVQQEAKGENSVLAVHEHELAYDETFLQVLLVGLDMISARAIISPEVDWIWHQYGADNAYGFTLLENDTGQSRYTEIVVEDRYGYSNIIKVTQHSKTEI